MLLATLTPEQHEDFMDISRGRWQGFNVRGSDGAIHRVLRLSRTNNVLARNPMHGIPYLYGCNPIGYFDDRLSMDRFIAQKIFIECDAPLFRGLSCVDWPLAAGIRVMEKIGDYGGKI